MRTLLLFIFRIRAFLLFVAFEALCFWLIFANNPYQSAAFFNSSNEVAATLLGYSSNAREFLSLTEQNQILNQENAILKAKLANIELLSDINKDTTILSGFGLSDSAYYYIPAKVINQSLRNTQNYLTIDKGSNHGIEEGMGVISSDGIVGRIKIVGKNFSTITSVLHRDVLTSSVIQSNNSIGSVQWAGQDPTMAKLLYIPRHIVVTTGDAVVTSGFSTVYPPAVPVGNIVSKEIRGDATYYDINIRLSTDFTSLKWVYVIGNKTKAEKISVENLTLGISE
jgi:rod shape-determining protein MreC